jgi:DNA-directed RNA polymerase specialized sigma24 family protein
MNDYHERTLYYVYKHIDPRDSVCKYIGHGWGARAWIHGSRKTCLRSQEHLDWILKLMDEGFLPEDWVYIEYKGLTKSQACQEEQRLIRHYKPSFNKCLGVALLKFTPDLYQEATELREEGLSYKSIGDILGLSTMTVHRGLNGKIKNMENYSG